GGGRAPPRRPPGALRAGPWGDLQGAPGAAAARLLRAVGSTAHDRHAVDPHRRAHRTRRRPQHFRRSRRPLSASEPRGGPRARPPGDRRARPSWRPDRRPYLGRALGPGRGRGRAPGSHPDRRRKRRLASRAAHRRCPRAPRARAAPRPGARSRGRRSAPVTDRRFAGLLAGLLALVLLVSAASLAVGSTEIPARRIPALLWNAGASLDRPILVDLRLPRILLAVLIGLGLAGAGTAYQGLFLNPLADPFVIGASSGAALGATLAILSGWERALGVGALPLSAFLGALAAVGLVYLLGGRASPLGLLLAGAAVSTVVGSLVSLLMILHDQSLGVLFNWL